MGVVAAGVGDVTDEDEDLREWTTCKIQRIQRDDVLQNDIFLVAGNKIWIKKFTLTEKYVLRALQSAEKKTTK